MICFYFFKGCFPIKQTRYKKKFWAACHMMSMLARLEDRYVMLNGKCVLDVIYFKRPLNVYDLIVILFFV